MVSVLVAVGVAGRSRNWFGIGVGTIVANLHYILLRLLQFILVAIVYCFEMRITSPVTASHPGVQGLVVLSVNPNKDTETGFYWHDCTAVKLLRILTAILSEC